MQLPYIVTVQTSSSHARVPILPIERVLKINSNTEKFRWLYQLHALFSEGVYKPLVYLSIMNIGITVQYNYHFSLYQTPPSPKVVAIPEVLLYITPHDLINLCLTLCH